MPSSEPLPPHFPQPGADPIAVLEARIAEQDEIIADQYREMKAWQAQLVDALSRCESLQLALNMRIDAEKAAPRSYHDNGPTGFEVPR